MFYSLMKLKQKTFIWSSNHRLGVVTICYRSATCDLMIHYKHTYLYKETKVTTICVSMDLFSFLFITQ